MAMLIAWQVCNKVTYPQDKRFSKNVLVVAPGLTVKSRLQVLKPEGTANYYREFDVVPPSLSTQLQQGRVTVINWQALAWDSAEVLQKRRGVDKRGPKSDEAYARGILNQNGSGWGRTDGTRAHNILVINDEAHHAWRLNPEYKDKKTDIDKDEQQEATVWVSGLDRLQKARGINCCYDFSATPFAPSGKKNERDALFSWIVSDFGLNDGIESGLVKTPRVVVRDDGKLTPDYKSRLYHIYVDPDVRENLSAPAKETDGLPDLVTNAYNLLAADWQATYDNWQKNKSPVPPVMITVCNRTETAARIEYAFVHRRGINYDELSKDGTILHIDSKTLEKEGTEGDKLREKVDTVGQQGKLGEQIRNVISVGMLSEGWDAKTVTHIMGLRAFSSQLLCEQVVGRGLRRTSYDVNPETGLFESEYVNIFGIPFSFLPQEDTGGGGGTAKPKTQVLSLPDRMQYEIIWPNILRIDRELDPRLHLDISKVPPLTLDYADNITKTDLAPIVDYGTDLRNCATIDLEKLDTKYRLQTFIFNTAVDIFEMASNDWKAKATPYALIGQIFDLVETYINSGRIHVEPAPFMQNKTKLKLLFILNMNRIVRHLWDYIQYEETARFVPFFNPAKKTRSTADMPSWWTSKYWEPTEKSQIDKCVFDSKWEDTESYLLEKNEHVKAWVKNDHIGFEVSYIWQGIQKRYRPDFLIRLDNGVTLILETKGVKSEQSEAKRKALTEWIDAVNSLGDYGIWASDISYNTADVDGMIEKYSKTIMYLYLPGSERR
jgi:type III restriction enzyme